VEELSKLRVQRNRVAKGKDAINHVRMYILSSGFLQEKNFDFGKIESQVDAGQGVRGTKNIRKIVKPQTKMRW
jgi:hypothetical protein